MKEILAQLVSGQPLTRQQACDLIHSIVNNQINEVQISAILMALAMRGVHIDEILGLRDGLLQTGQSVDLGEQPFIDIVGTGGDGKNTFNISTCSCFVVAGAGYNVAKHGNFSATSVSGASNVMQAHGVKFTNNQDLLRSTLDQCHFVFLHAPLFAIGMKAVAPIRQKILIPTCFNILGPLVNPAQPKYQALGVANLTQMRLYAGVCDKLNINYGIVNSIDGYDEISLTGDFKIKTNRLEQVYNPTDFNFPLINPKQLYGGKTVQKAAEIFDEILENRSNEQRKNVVLINAAFAINIIEPLKSSEDCLGLARDSLESGKALNVLKKFIELNN